MLNAENTPQLQETTEPTAILEMLHVWEKFVKAGGLLFLATLLLYVGVDIAYSHDEDYMYEPTSKLRQTAIGVFIWLLGAIASAMGSLWFSIRGFTKQGFSNKNLTGSLGAALCGLIAFLSAYLLIFLAVPLFIYSVSAIFTVKSEMKTFDDTTEFSSSK